MKLAVCALIKRSLRLFSTLVMTSALTFPGLPSCAYMPSMSATKPARFPVIKASTPPLSRSEISFCPSSFIRASSDSNNSPAAVGIQRMLSARLNVNFVSNVRSAWQAAPKTINEEVGFLLRLLGERGDAIRIHLRREKTLKLAVRNNVGKAYSKEQKEALLAVAQGKLAKKSIPVCGTDNEKKAKVRSPFILPALTLAFHTGMRDAEIRNLTWNQIDFDKRYLTVDKSKSDAGEGRTIPLNGSLFSALLKHAQWYTNRFGTTTPEWFIFPGRIGKPKKGEPRPYDPSRPVTSLKTAWRTVKKAAEVSGRFHDTRHTLITELCESGAGDQTIMDIAGHVSRQMMARYSHIRMEAKRRALEAIDSVPKSRPAEGAELKESTIAPRLTQ